MAQIALETGLGVPIAEQLRQGEWLTGVVVPLRGIFFITVTIATHRGEEHEDIDAGHGNHEETDQQRSDGIVRIILARESTWEEQTIVECRPPSVG